MADLNRSITIVGGGLAGMVAALRLLQLGCDVTIYDADARLGGKAGANSDGSERQDHGYHIFPMWYLNIWALVEELGLQENFVDRTDFVEIKPQEFPRSTTLRNMGSPWFAWHNLTSGALPFLQLALVYYFGLDLMGTPLRQKAFLDQITVSGFIRSRFYRTEALAEQCQDLILKGISTPSYFASAMTMRTVLQSWAKYPEPMCRILNGNLQDKWIEPLANRLRSLGCKIHLEHRLERLRVRENVVTQLSLRNLSNGEARDVDAEIVLLAVPTEQVCALLDETLYEAAPELSALFNLRSRPMAALNIYLRQPIPGLSSAHTNLLGSQYGLSFIDVSQAWPGLNATVINLIASNCSDLATLPAGVAQRQILSDLRRFLPQLEDNNIQSIVFEPHVDAPLLTNEVGMWSSRPGAKTSIPNLFLAGDYCRTHVDLVCMEGAVTSALHAAEAIRLHVGAAGRIAIYVPRFYPRWIWYIAKVLLLPFAAVAKLVLMLQGPERKSKPKSLPRFRDD